MRYSLAPAVHVHLVDISLFYPARTGGVRTYLRAKARWLRERTSLRHTIIAPVLRDDDDPDLIAIPSFPIPFSHGFRWPLSAALATRRLISLQPQLIEAGDPYQFAWSALQARKRLNIAALAFYHSDLPQLAMHRFGPLGQLAAENYLRKLYAQFDLVLAPSRASLRKLQSLGIDQVRHQPLGVDTVVFAPDRRDRWLKRRLGLADGCRLLVYAGRFSREKNLASLIAAVEMLGSPYHLLLIGGGQKLPATGRVSCLPYQQDAATLAALIGACDLFVHPGQHETFGLVVLEAMACGLPVLGVAGGGVAELVTADTGRLTGSGNSASLAAGISGLFDADLAAMGGRARQKAVSHYAWECVMPQLMRHYESLLGSRKVRAGEIASLST